MNNIDVRYSVGALLYSPALNDKLASSILNVGLERHTLLRYVLKIRLLTQQLDKHWNNSEIHLRRFIWHLLRMM